MIRQNVPHWVHCNRNSVWVRPKRPIGLSGQTLGKTPLCDLPMVAVHDLVQGAWPERSTAPEPPLLDWSLPPVGLLPRTSPSYAHALFFLRRSKNAEIRPLPTILSAPVFPPPWLLVSCPSTLLFASHLSAFSSCFHPSPFTFVFARRGRSIGVGCSAVHPFPSPASTPTLLHSFCRSSRHRGFTDSTVSWRFVHRRCAVKSSTARQESHLVVALITLSAGFGPNGTVLL